MPLYSLHDTLLHEAMVLVKTSTSTQSVSIQNIHTPVPIVLKLSNQYARWHELFLLA